MTNANKETLLTEEGLQNIEAELEELIVVKRQEIAERIKEARSFGDISENAEYDEAKNAQAELELRIEKLENLIKFAKVVDEDDIPKGQVYVGSIVKVRDEETGEEETYEIVGATEADPFENKVTVESPIGAALMGKKKNAICEVETPAGKILYKIISIRK
ncbi:transcription elongation factor GreA [Guggenheimella bovis]